MVFLLCYVSQKAEAKLQLYYCNGNIMNFRCTLIGSCDAAFLPLAYQHKPAPATA